MKFTFCWFILFLFLCACEARTPEEEFDLNNQQTAILSRQKIDSVLNLLPPVNYNELDKDYITYSASDQKKFKQILSSKTYRIVRGDAIFLYVVGKSRIKDFLATDGYYSRNSRNTALNSKQYWLIDPQLLYKFLDIMNDLKQQGYNPFGFRIRESHRHPKYNALRGGASKSQHIYGKAADLVVEDINLDGTIDQSDKEILLQTAEKIIGNQGGVGLYPNTMTVHVDTRGYRARW